ERRQRLEAAHAGHRQVEHDQRRLELPRELDRLGRPGRLAGEVEAVRGEEGTERFPRERMVVHDEDPCGHAHGRLCRYRAMMRRAEDRSEFEGFLWGELILVALLAAALTLFLSRPGLRNEYRLPELRLVLATVY